MNKVSNIKSSKQQNTPSLKRLPSNANPLSPNKQTGPGRKMNQLKLDLEQITHPSRQMIPTTLTTRDTNTSPKLEQTGRKTTRIAQTERYSPNVRKRETTRSLLQEKNFTILEGMDNERVPSYKNDLQSRIGDDKDLQKKLYNTFHCKNPNIVDGMAIPTPDYQLYPSKLRTDNYKRIKSILGNKYLEMEWCKDEDFSSALGEVLFEIVKGGVQDYNQYLNKPHIDQKYYWMSIIENIDNNNFELILIYFLLKIDKIDDDQVLTCSSYYCGKVVNLLLQNFWKLDILYKYRKLFLEAFIQNMYYFERKMVK